MTDCRSSRCGAMKVLRFTPSVVRIGTSNKEAKHMRKNLFLLAILLVATLGMAQQTVLNVPSADVLDKGKAFVRLDTSFMPSLEQSAFAPNLVYGFGHNVEGGVNIESFSYPDTFTTSLVPNIKYRYDGFMSHGEGIALTFGDKVYIPVHNHSFDLGNYLYGTATSGRGQWLPSRRRRLQSAECFPVAQSYRGF
jgi:hypothetical protein